MSSDALLMIRVGYGQWSSSGLNFAFDQVICSEVTVTGDQKIMSESLSRRQVENTIVGLFRGSSGPKIIYVKLITRRLVSILLSGEIRVRYVRCTTY